ncbi:hypothetical protein V2V56_03100 [Streptococcus agalactiae]|uniref:hypothetical protein n=1 Tax=uncultured Streptococcus sp. TaxID=83427 RepID=UPI00287FF5A4|nr:hypothetical protein [uncultured Streptococcus sp.]
MEKENIRMRLSSESKIILDKLQKDIYSKLGYEVSYSSLVSQAVRQFVPKKDSIDWIQLKETSLKFSSTEQSDWDYQTSFMLEEDVLTLLSELQNYFLEVFQAKRIHRAFCVRLCLKAQFLSISSNNDL